MANDPGASMPRVQVVFRRMVSDGNYGHEVAEATLEQDLLPGEEGDGEITATLLLGLARKVVYAELGRSHNGSIRRTLDFEQRTAAPAKAEPEPEVEYARVLREAYDEPDVDDEPPPDYGPPGSGAVVTEYAVGTAENPF